MRCGKCGARELGWEPPRKSDPASCVPCSTPERNESLSRTCAASSCSKDAKALYWDYSKNPSDNYCLNHSWKSWAWQVDISDLTEKIISIAQEWGFKNTQHLSANIAVARLLKGKLLKPNSMKTSISDSHGDSYVVKCASNRWPYEKFYPSSAINRKERIRSDIILTAFNGSYSIPEEVYVLGYIGAFDWHKESSRQPWGYFLQFQPSGRWKRIEEVFPD